MFTILRAATSFLDWTFVLTTQRSNTWTLSFFNAYSFFYLNRNYFMIHCWDIVLSLLFVFVFLKYLIKLNPRSIKITVLKFSLLSFHSILLYFYHTGQLNLTLHTNIITLLINTHKLFLLYKVTYLQANNIRA